MLLSNKHKIRKHKIFLPINFLIIISIFTTDRRKDENEAHLKSQMSAEQKEHENLRENVHFNDFICLFIFKYIKIISKYYKIKKSKKQIIG